MHKSSLDIPVNQSGDGSMRMKRINLKGGGDRSRRATHLLWLPAIVNCVSGLLEMSL